MPRASHGVKRKTPEEDAMRTAITHAQAATGVVGRLPAIIGWALRLVAAVILLQTLFFKFTAAPESVYIFTAVHAEPWGRIGSGIVELVASILLLVPATTWMGALLAAGTMSGAIATHLTVLGIQVMGDGGLLFVLALAVLCSCLGLLYIDRRKLAALIGRSR
jgi:uncharacterized membrane protein YphA (DoxX/SURF4 family)